MIFVRLVQNTVTKQAISHHHHNTNTNTVPCWHWHSLARRTGRKELSKDEVSRKKRKKKASFRTRIIANFNLPSLNTRKKNDLNSSPGTLNGSPNNTRLEHYSSHRYKRGWNASVQLQGRSDVLLLLILIAGVVPLSCFARSPWHSILPPASQLQGMQYGNKGRRRYSVWYL